jgi:acyl-CoA synthetase (AMP-forming)/AMP-acid ligase II
VLVLSRSALNADHARLAEPGEPSIAVVSVGRPMPGTSVSIVRHDRVLPEGRIGEIEVWGPSVCPGYVGAGDADLREGRFLSGDLGFVHGGELFITGRKKDMIIVAGRNIYPFDLEHVVRDVAGEKIRRAAAFGVPDPRTGTEQIVIAIERAGRYRMDAQLAHAIRSAAAEAAGTANVEVVELDPVPITSSGKTQRGRARELHLAGRSEGVPTGP